MQLNQIQEVLNNYKPGTFIKVCWEKDISSAKAKKQGITITKRCEGIVRTGINYKNVKNVVVSESSQDHVSWFEHCDMKGLIQSKSDNSKKYLQLYPVKGNKIKTVIASTNIYESNLEKLYELGYITKSSLTKTDELIVMNLGIENIIKFGK